MNKDPRYVTKAVIDAEKCKDCILSRRSIDLEPCCDCKTINKDVQAPANWRTYFERSPGR
jgi:hypothetical protein